MRRSTSYLLALLIAAAFVGCGKNEGGSEQDSSGGDQSYIIKQPETQAEKEAAAEAKKTPEGELKLLKKQVKKARAGLDCPAKTESKRAEGTPVDDIQGVRLGMPYNEALNIVLCSNEMITLSHLSPEYTFAANHFGFGEKMREGFQADLQTVIHWDDANQKSKYFSDVITNWQVSTSGLPDQERVVLIKRLETYENDKNPSLSAVEKALIGKYGNPTKRYDDEYLYLFWAHDTLGRPVTETSPLFRECHVIEYGMYLHEKCGIVITATVERVSTNKELVKLLSIVIRDDASTTALLSDAEQKYLEMDKSKRAKDVQDAEKNSATPQL